MRKYLAIGHFKENKNITCVAMKSTTKKNFQQDLIGNGFVAFVVITEKRFESLKMLDRFDLFYEIKKMTSNYRVWNDVSDYIDQCLDIMEERLQKA